MLEDRPEENVECSTDTSIRVQIWLFYFFSSSLELLQERGERLGVEVNHKRSISAHSTPALIFLSATEEIVSRKKWVRWGRDVRYVLNHMIYSYSRHDRDINTYLPTWIFIDLSSFSV